MNIYVCGVEYKWKWIEFLYNKQIIINRQHELIYVHVNTNIVKKALRIMPECFISLNKMIAYMYVAASMFSPLALKDVHQVGCFKWCVKQVASTCQC